jgi:hypothetical protein
MSYEITILSSNKKLQKNKKINKEQRKVLYIWFEVPIGPWEWQPATLVGSMGGRITLKGLGDD